MKTKKDYTLDPVSPAGKFFELFLKNEPHKLSRKS